MKDADAANNRKKGPAARPADPMNMKRRRSTGGADLMKDADAAAWTAGPAKGRMDRTNMKRRQSAGGAGPMTDADAATRTEGASERMDRTNLTVGWLTVNPRGFGFVTPERGGGDVHVAGFRLGSALHGDRVAVRVEGAGDRAEGRIVEVLERANPDVVGRYEVDEAGQGRVAPFDERVALDLRIPAGGSLGAEPGQMVAAAVDQWPAAGRAAAGHVVEVLGSLDEPGVDTAIVIRKHGLPDGHDPDAEAEAARLGDEVAPGDLAGRTDFRGLPTVTIDGETARDFDDAVTLETLPGGNRRLGVHIADVAHYVRAGSALDESAYRRGTSVYFPERAIHMFPARLATGLCSLKPGVDRLVQSCLMEIDGQGEVVRHELHDGVIRSDARMTYDEVDAILTARDAGVRERYAALAPMLEAMDALARRLAARREARGALDLDLHETRLVLDEAGQVADVVAAERNAAHRVVEEFMLIANETVAARLEDGGAPALFRVHEPPDPAKAAEFDDFAATLGHGLEAPPDRVQPRHFQRLLARLKGTPAERPVALLMLRTMQKARYDPLNVGHFGLASDVYTHFTSPIRRYPDLVVHRLVRELRRSPRNRADDRAGGLAGPSAASSAARRPRERADGRADGLAGVARHASAMERRAEEAERELVQWKKVRFMADKVGEEFTGHVVGVTRFGLFVELVEYFVEGLAHVSGMADDYYRFRGSDHALCGEASGKVYRLGDRLEVQVLRVDAARRQIDLGVVEILDALRASERRPGPRPRRAARVRRPRRGRVGPRRARRG